MSRYQDAAFLVCIVICTVDLDEHVISFKVDQLSGGVCAVADVVVRNVEKAFLPLSRRFDTLQNIRSYGIVLMGVVGMWKGRNLSVEGKD